MGKGWRSGKRVGLRTCGCWKGFEDYDKDLYFADRLGDGTLVEALSDGNRNRSAPRAAPQGDNRKACPLRKAGATFAALISALCFREGFGACNSLSFGDVIERIWFEIPERIGLAAGPADFEKLHSFSFAETEVHAQVIL